MATYQRLPESEAGATLQAVPATQGASNVPITGSVQQPPPYIIMDPSRIATSQQANTNVVVASQPTHLPAVTVSEPRLKPKPVIMIVTIILTMLCTIQGCIPMLVCLVPAVVFSIVGYSLSDSATQRSTAKAFHGVAILCNIAATVFYILVGIGIIVWLGVWFGVYYGRYDYYGNYNYYGGGCYNQCTPNYNYNSNYNNNYEDYDYWRTTTSYYQDWWYRPSPSPSSECHTICIN